MSTQAVIETYIDTATKLEAEAILAAEGLTIDQVIRNVLQRTVTEHTAPYGLFGPNIETREAMDELRNGGGKRFASVSDLMADLNADD